MDDLQAHPVPDRHSIARARVAVRDLLPMLPAMTTRGNPLQIDTKCLLDPWPDTQRRIDRSSPRAGSSAQANNEDSDPAEFR